METEKLLEELKDIISKKIEGLDKSERQEVLEMLISDMNMWLESERS